MLEGLATWVLNNYLGQYFENLNTDQLSIGLLSGEVELENVPLRKDALRHLDIPLQVVSGFVGRVKLQIPVARLRSEPWVVVFETLYGIVAPINLEQYDAEGAAAASHARKLYNLDGLEASWRAEQATRSGESYSASQTSWFNFGTSIITNIVENIQLRIHNVHLRYEDNQSIPGRVFSCGLTIRSLTVQSTDSNWTPMFVKNDNNSDGVSYKLLELSDLSLYWDTSSTLLHGLELPQLIERLGEANSHQYILQPVSATACLRRHLSPSPLKSRNQPRLSCHITIQSFPIQLSDQQYSQMVLVNRLYDRLNKCRHFIKWRPNCCVKGNAKDWWNYAIQSHIDQIRERNKNSSWDFVVQRSSELLQYVDSYTEQLTNPTSLPKEHKELMDQLELELGFTELKFLRELAMSRVEERTPKHSPVHTVNTGSIVESNTSSTASDPKSPPIESPTSQTLPPSPSSELSSQGETLLWRWFPSWKGWYSEPQQSAATSSVASLESPEGDQTLGGASQYYTPEASVNTNVNSDTESLGSMSPSKSRTRHISTSLEEELLYVLTDNMENNTFMKRDAVFCQISFSLKQGNFAMSTENICKPSSEKTELVVLEFSNVQIGLESRPRNKSFKFDIQLGSLYLRDQITKDPSFPYLLAPQAQLSSYPHSSMSRTSSVPSHTSTRSSTLFSRSLSTKTESDNSSGTSRTTETPGQLPLFSLSYEHSPLNMQADRKLCIITQPLDLVYNPAAIDAATEMFLKPLQSKSKYHQHVHQDPSTFSIAAKKRYDALMEQTKQELRKNWEQIMHGGMRKQWAITLDISAPQIIIPESFQDQHSPLVVIDLGRLTFCSANADLTGKNSFKAADSDKASQSGKNKSGGWGNFMAKMLGRTSEEEEENSEQFATPCSTPDEIPFSEHDFESDVGDIPSEALTEELLHSHMYDKYELKLCDMQVMVGKVKDNWRFAYRRGTGPMHVIDRFSISVLVSRRLVSVVPSDRPWPTATLAATVPNIMLHLNQAKVQGLVALLNNMSKRKYMHSKPQPSHTNTSNLKHAESLPNVFSNESFLASRVNESPVDNRPSSRKVSDSADISDSSSRVEDSRLLVVQINIEKLSIELMSRGRSIAEVQVTGVKGVVQHRPHNYSATLSIHSFLLVDALQTFGPDFELLVASHKHISIDSVSGSLMDSDPCSPTSPASPDHNMMPGMKSTSPVVLKRALNALASAPSSVHGSTSFMRTVPSSPPPLSSPPGLGVDALELDSEALICLEVTYISSECPSQEGSGPLLLGSLQFNTIDLIANQETVVELIGFIHQLIPQSCTNSGVLPTSTISTSSKKADPSSTGKDSYVGLDESVYKPDNQSMYSSIAVLYNASFTDPKENPEASKEPIRVEMSFDFAKLSVLLLRATVKDKEIVGRKVGTAVLSQAKIQTSIANNHLTVEGSLGGFQVRDITPEPNKHHCIISVGQDALIEKQQDIVSKLTSNLYQSYAERQNESPLKAFSFNINRPLAFAGSTDASSDDYEKLFVKLELASVLYTHSHAFLNEVLSCVEEFRKYTGRLAQGIKHAATEMAMGLVSKRIESFAALPGYSTGTGSESPLHRRNSLAFSTDTLHLPQPPPATASHTSPTHTPPSDLSFRLNLDITLETPIVVFPESSTSSSVMVAQLGQICVKNKAVLQANESLLGNTSDNIRAPFKDSMDTSLSRKVQYEVSVRDMSLYCLEIDERKAARQGSIIGPPLRCAADLYRCGSDCSPIIHSTSIELVLSHERSHVLVPDSHSGMFMFPQDLYMHAVDDLYSPGMSTLADSLTITGGVVTAVKLTVSRQQYRQLTQTLSNLSMSGQRPATADRHTLSSIDEEEVLVNDSNKSSSVPLHKHKSEPNKTSHPSTDSKTASDACTTRKDSSKFSVYGGFSVPRVEVELLGDVNGCCQPLVNLILEEFQANYSDEQEFKSITCVTLKSLVMEDLQCPEDSPHRFLLRSIEQPHFSEPSHDNKNVPNCQRVPPPPFISTSCPSRTAYHFQHEDISKSLPTRLEIEKPYFKVQKRTIVRESVRRKRKLFQQQGKRSSMTMPGLFNEPTADVPNDNEKMKNPYTPPPSPVQENTPVQTPDSASTLVKIKITSIDENDPDFIGKYDGTHKFVNVDFNSLVAVVNIPSWVMILDFFSKQQRRESSSLYGFPSDKSTGDIFKDINDSIDGLLDRSEFTHPVNINVEQEEFQSDRNTVVDISIVWLELGFVRVDGCGSTGVEVAGASVSDVTVRSVGSGGDLTLSGRLGSLSVTDRTSYGHRYRHKFLTSGDEALTFQLFKYGLPDVNMQRECDMRLNIKMASVMYIHTQRFATELLHVLQQFTQLQTIVEKWRAIRAGEHVLDNTRGARVSLSVTAGSPVIILPLCAEGSDKVLVADLGSLGVTNKFLWAGTEGTISKIEREALNERLKSDAKRSGMSRSRSRPNRSRSRSLGRSRSRHNTSSETGTKNISKPPKCLLDVMHVTLTNMDLHAAIRTDVQNNQQKSGYLKACKRNSTSHTRYKRGVDIPHATQKNKDEWEEYDDDEQNEDATELADSWQFPDISIIKEGQPLLKEKCALTLQVERNLDTQVSHRVPDVSVQGCLSKVYATINEETYMIIRGLLQYNLGENLDELHYQQRLLHHPHLPSHANIRDAPGQDDDDVFITLDIAMDLDNVIVEVLLESQDSTENFRSASSVVSLTCVNLIKSRLLYQSNSEGGKDVDLVSQEILLLDNRFQDCPANKRANVHTSILQPTPLNTSKNESLLQAELHYRSTKEITRFTILVNNMRVLAVLDWWREVLKFIQLQSPNPYQFSSYASSVVNLPASKVGTPHIVESIGNASPVSAASPRSTSPGALNRLRSSSYSSLSRKSSGGGFGRASPRLNPLVESTGVMTKHTLIHQEDQLGTNALGSPLENYLDPSLPTCAPPPFELKINITDSEIVVVEDTSLPNSGALIFKNTTVLSYRPSMTERPVSCNLSHCEVYSCILSAEVDTALSILDPVTINIEMTDRGCQQPNLASGALLSVQHVIEVTMHQVNVRFSYHDMKMFQRIMESIPWNDKGNTTLSSRALSDQDQPVNVKAQIERLSALGFLKEDCQIALSQCEGRLDDAAIWLTRHAAPAPAHTVSPHSPQQDPPHPINYQAIEIKTGSVNLCVIDDCGDCDVPLLEISLLQLLFKQDRTWTGSASGSLLLNYYNRSLSGWEPLLEPWRCSMEWKKQSERLSVQLSSREVMELSITSSLIDLFKMVKNSWTQDYYNRDRCDSDSRHSSSGGSSARAESSPLNYRRRCPFIPFTLLNETGSSLSFTTFTSYTHGGSDVPSITLGDSGVFCDPLHKDWITVTPGQSVPFSFDRNTKLRHGDTHQHKMHQVGVCVQGWHPVGPVTVDKVGTFFRMAAPVSSVSSTGSLPSTRIVLSVSLAGSARKLVTVRSALQLRNTLPCAIEAKLENLANRGGDVKLVHVASQSTYCIPLSYVWAGIKVKPLGTGGVKRPLSRGGAAGSGGWVHCHEPIHWRMFTGQREQHSQLVSCPAINATQPPYRLCVHIQRENFPLDHQPPAGSARRPPTPPLMNPMQPQSSSLPSPLQEWIQPAHTITLVSPLTLVNLLPLELHFSIPNNRAASPSNSKAQAVSSPVGSNAGIIRPGDKAILHTVDQEDTFQLRLWTESFSCKASAGGCVNISSSGSSRHQLFMVQLQDSAGRSLDLLVRVTKYYGKALKLHVSAHYWLLNNTGLPLIFKQESSSTDAAGQESDHELARCGVPLLFSFSDKEAPPMLTMRAGRQLHHQSIPHYCSRLPLTQGAWVRKLRVSPPDNRPDFVYIVGVDVRPGEGLYRDTLMVTVSPRYKIENRSSRELLVAQTCCTDGSITRGRSTWLNCLPGSFVAFHWPRLDKDQTISVKILSQQPGYWSGGFTIEKIVSFHLNVRGSNGESMFLRVETLVKDATHFVIISDADNFPPPFRIDNFSEVPINYFQTGTQSEHLRSIVKPHCSVPYAWDEPTLKPHLTCTAPGGVSATYNLNELRPGANLTYENFIYIAFTGTFQNLEQDSHDSPSSSPSVCLDPRAVECQQLVLDVVNGTKVQLSRKQLGKRSQLWRMTSTGRLQHEGSSPPTDPTQPRKDDHNGLVLDISGTAPQPRAFTALMLRRPDPRRQMTQTWQFTKDGRLCCKHHQLYVQAKDGFLGLTPGNTVVLGPSQTGVEYSRMGSTGVPLEQAVSRQRLRPGSGILKLEVVTDGPTRVLQITDIHTKHPVVARTEAGELVTLCGTQQYGAAPKPDGDETSVRGNTEERRPTVATAEHITEFQLQVSITGGVGVSVVQQSPPLELLYGRLSDILLDYHSAPHQRTLDATVRNIQLDNQVVEGVDGSVLLMVTPQSKSDNTRHLPALNLAMHQLLQPSGSTAPNALIFKNLRVCLKNLSLTLEEEVLCRVLMLLGYHLPDAGSAPTDAPHESRPMQSTMSVSSPATTRYYFGLLELKLKQVRLSVVTNKHLSPELRSVRRKVGLNSLVRFENAQVSLDPFVRLHPFETAAFLWDSITKHYTEQLTSQAVKILGSTDFLGNPSGLLADVSEGMSELMNQGSVQGLVFNVTHGLSNSAAKVTGSLSDSLGRVTMDATHEALRQRYVMRSDGGSVEQIFNGVRGLGLGFYGGFISIVAQTYTGAQQDGVPGLISGFAKGVVGTVTKPAVGVLDFVSGAAYAVRDTSKTPLSRSVARERLPRVVLGLTGLLPPYNETLAQGQHMLKSMPLYTPTEILIAYEWLREGSQEMRVLVSSERIRFFTQPEPDSNPQIVLTTVYSDIIDCEPVVIHDHPSDISGDSDSPLSPLDSSSERHYVQLTISSDPRLHSAPVKKPRVRCDSKEITQKVSQQINCGRQLHAELWQTVSQMEGDEVE